MAAQARQAKVLRIGIIQDGKIVQERLIRSGESVTVGESTRNTFVLPGGRLPRKEYPLFVAGRSGYVLNFTRDMRGKISSGGAVVGLDKLRNDPGVHRESKSWRLPLTEQDRGKIRINGVTILFQFVSPPPAQAVKPLMAMDFRPRILDDDDPIFLGFLAIFTALAVVLLIWVWNTEPPKTRSLAEIPDRFTKLVLEQQDIEIKEIELDDLQGPSTLKEEPKEQEAEASGAGEKEGPKTAVEKAKHREDLKQSVTEKSLLLKMFVNRGENPRGETAEDLWSEADKGLEDLDAAVRDVKGVEVAGSGNQDLRKGAGGTSEDVDIGDLRGVGGGSSELGGGPEVEVTGEVDLGTPSDLSEAGDAPAVRGVVEEHFGQLTYCYEQQLKLDPGLGGRVEVEWHVRGGRVTSANVFANTTGNSELGRCIVSKIRRWRFPESVEGEILYPFIFKRKG
ncbi:MAG: energy transducer TonB [Deltaproteobacteria bacterium]|nr:energy transducer TonB [Deltaproteobacteria bacterium]MBW2252966.1 energy transducer TonB [Deltaproteobacteria bacterium]